MGAAAAGAAAACAADCGGSGTGSGQIGSTVVEPEETDCGGFGAAALFVCLRA